MYLFCNNIHCLKYLKTSQFPSIYIYTNQARTFIMCRTLIIFYVLFRPGHLLSTGRLFFLMQSSGQDAYLGTPFIRYRRVHIPDVFKKRFNKQFESFDQRLGLTVKLLQSRLFVCRRFPVAIISELF